MTDYKVLGQDAPAAGVETNSYSVPATKSSVVRAINVTNTFSTADTFDIAINDSALVPVATPTYVTVAINSQANASSTDGITWTQGTLPETNFYSVTYGNSTFVAVARNSYGLGVASSIDGTTWTPRTLPNSYWQSVTYGNGIFVAVAFSYFGSATAASSTDGITWTQGTLPVEDSWDLLAYGDSTFVAVASGTTNVATSTDGITWTQRTLPAPSGNYSSISYGEGKFIALQSSFYGSNQTAYSTDGITWSSGTISSSDSWSSIAYGNGIFVAVSNSYSSSFDSAYSTDGISWSSSTLPVDRNWKSITYGNNTFVAVAYGSNTAATSTDGIAWTQGTLPASVNWYSVAYGDPNALPSIPSEDYLFKSHEILGNETITIKGGYTLDENNTIRVKSTNGTTTFNIFGGEI